MRRVVVTGGSGFLGSRLVRALLDQRINVKVIDTRYGELEGLRSRTNLEFVGIGSDEIVGGMTDSTLVAEAVTDVDVIYHLAINWNGASWKHKLPLADLFNTNIRGTLNLLEAAKSSNVKHLLFSSSAAVYGETERTLRLNHRGETGKATEETVCRPELWDGDPGPAYAILKFTTEKLCLMYHHRFGLPVTVFRIEYMFEGREELSDGANIHVEDVVKAFLLATLNKKAYGQVLNLADRTPYMSATRARRLLGWKPTKTVEFLSSARPEK